MLNIQNIKSLKKIKNLAFIAIFCKGFIVHYHRIAGGTEPVTFWHLSDLWPKTEHVPSTITAIT